MKDCFDYYTDITVTHKLFLASNSSRTHLLLLLGLVFDEQVDGFGYEHPRHTDDRNKYEQYLEVTLNNKR